MPFMIICADSWFLESNGGHGLDEMYCDGTVFDPGAVACDLGEFGGGVDLG
jgi:hypothetical protein